MNPVVILTALLGGVILTALFGFPALLLWSTQLVLFWSLIVVLVVTALFVRRKSSL